MEFIAENLKIFKNFQIQTSDLNVKLIVASYRMEIDKWKASTSSVLSLVISVRCIDRCKESYRLATCGRTDW